MISGFFDRESVRTRIITIYLHGLKF